MKAGDELLGTVFSKGHRYIVPIFQRPYVWDEEANWIPLWSDLVRAAEEAEREADGQLSEDPHEYFLGAFVTQHRPPAPRRTPTSQVIDGQQRLTTFQVFLAAARRVSLLVGAQGPAERFAALTTNQVPADSEYPEDRYKVTPLRADQAAFQWALRSNVDAIPAPDPEHRLAQAAAFFEKALVDWVGEADDATTRLDYLHFVVENRIKVVSVFLDGRDDPQVIFEALNHRGVRLDAADLVKNLLFQTLDQQGEHARQEELHDKYWRVLDGDQWRQRITTGRIKRVRVDALLAYWLSVQRGEESSVEHLFEEVKRWLKHTGVKASEVIPDIRLYADTMERLQALHLTSPVAQFIDRLEANRTTTPWPLMLHIHSHPAIPEEQALKATAALDSFLMRRAMCRMDTKDYNRFFAMVLGVVKAAEPQEAGNVLVGTLVSQTAPTRSWPTDSEFMAALIKDDLYNTILRARLKSFLVGLENQLLTRMAEPDAPRSALTSTINIEHLMPQEWSKHWLLPEAHTDADVAMRESHIHRLGNFTLTTKYLNSSLSNNPWDKKRHSLQTHSLVRLTTASVLTYPEGVVGGSFSQDEWASRWDESRIDMRTFWMIKLALDAWPRPDSQVSPEANTTSLDNK